MYGDNKNLANVLTIVKSNKNLANVLTIVKSNSVQTTTPAVSPLKSLMPFKDHSKHVTGDW